MAKDLDEPRRRHVGFEERPVSAENKLARSDLVQHLAEHMAEPRVSGGGFQSALGQVAVDRRVERRAPRILLLPESLLVGV